VSEISDLMDQCRDALGGFAGQSDYQATARFGRLVEAIKRGGERAQWVDELRLWSIAARVIDRIGRNIPGALVECGVAKGTSASVLAWASQEFQRSLWLFDTFTGLPPAGPVDERDHGDLSKYTGGCCGDLKSVKTYLATHWPRARVSLRPGLFEDVLPVEAAGVGAVAVLHADGDWYESTRTIIANFENALSAGAAILFDDYGYWKGCERAVEEWREDRAWALGPLQRVGSTQAWLNIERTERPC